MLSKKAARPGDRNAPGSASAPRSAANPPSAVQNFEARFRLGYPGFDLDVDLRVPKKGITAILGPPGAGKTTLLRCIAGLTRAPSGRLVVAGEVWQDDVAGIFLPTYRRPVGVVFQDASLFPHLSVRGNLEYGMKQLAPAEKWMAFGDAIELLGLGPLLERATEKLSAAERQRVAIARALLVSPRLLLMDEPLAGLDAQRKSEILPYLERLHDRFAIPILYISHAPDEVARLADHLVLMQAGRIVASGALDDILGRIDLLPSFGDEAAVVVDTQIAAHQLDGLTRLGFSGGSLHVPRRPETIGETLRCRVLARDVSLTLSRHNDSSILNRIAAGVVDIVPAGATGHVIVRLDAGGTPLLARISERTRSQLGIVQGMSVWAQIMSVVILA